VDVDFNSNGVLDVQNIFNYPDYTQLDVVLYGPNGLSYDFGTNVAGLTTFTLTNFNNTIGQRNWRLVVTWNPATGERGYFNGRGLPLSGLAYYSVTGSVVAAGGSTNVPISGASLVLVGSNILPQSNTTTNGSFSFGSLTENEYTLTVSQLGYYPTNVAFNVDATNVTLPPIVLTPVLASAPSVTAAPVIGQAPLNIHQRALRLQSKRRGHPILPPAKHSLLPARRHLACAAQRAIPHDLHPRRLRFPE
jgi:hypothetical protein